MPTIRVLTANVGSGVWDIRYRGALRLTDVEERIARAIAHLKPDLIALQELLGPAQCTRFVERDPRKVCYEFQKKNPLYQARRLVGSDYTIICARGRRDCIAVHVSSGSIEGCKPGELRKGGMTMGLPRRGCSADFTVSSTTVILRGIRVTVVNAHIQAYGFWCRNWALRQIFEGVKGRSPLASGPRVLLLSLIHI